MSVLKRLALSLAAGVLLTTAFTWSAFRLGSEPAVSILLWQMRLFGALMTTLMGPGPLLGYDERGEPMYEGTPVHLFIGLFGILLGVPIYAALSYAALAWRGRRRRGPARGRSSEEL